MAANLLVSAVAIALGAFVAVYPSTAAKIWGFEKFDRLARPRKPPFFRRYRALGILLCLGGSLPAVESVAFPDHHP